MFSFKEFLGIAALAAFLVGVAVGVARGDEGVTLPFERQGTYVRASSVCDLEGAQALAKVWQTEADAPELGAQLERDGKCTGLPGYMALRILEVAEGPFTDWEGDVFFIVSVGDDKYTWAWPDFNSNLGKGGEMQRSSSYRPGQEI